MSGIGRPGRAQPAVRRPAGPPRLAARALVAAVRVYQLCLSPWLGMRCRYLPSCSAYAVEAVERFGVLRGTRLAAGRLLRCHPWGGSGYDPVPEAVSPNPGPRRPET